MWTWSGGPWQSDGAARVLDGPWAVATDNVVLFGLAATFGAAAPKLVGGHCELGTHYPPPARTVLSSVTGPPSSACSTQLTPCLHSVLLRLFLTHGVGTGHGLGRAIIDMAGLQHIDLGSWCSLFVNGFHYDGYTFPCWRDFDFWVLICVFNHIHDAHLVGLIVCCCLGF